MEEPIENPFDALGFDVLRKVLLHLDGADLAR
jgi:hypothetical protein